MHEVFLGWRRKVGLVALVMASVAAMLWYRSRYLYDYYGFGPSDDRVTQIIESSANGFLWRRLRTVGDPKLFDVNYRTGWFSSGQPDFIRVSTGDRLGDSFQHVTRCQCWGIDFGKGSVAVDSFPDHQIETAYCAVRYELLALPLTLLSAYLILWKPRKRDLPPSKQTLFGTN